MCVMLCGYLSLFHTVKPLACYHVLCRGTLEGVIFDIHETQENNDPASDLHCRNDTKKYITKPGRQTIEATTNIVL